MINKLRFSFGSKSGDYIELQVVTHTACLLPRSIKMFWLLNITFLLESDIPWSIVLTLLSSSVNYLSFNNNTVYAPSKSDNVIMFLYKPAIHSYLVEKTLESST